MRAEGSKARAHRRGTPVPAVTRGPGPWTYPEITSHLQTARCWGGQREPISLDIRTQKAPAGPQLLSQDGSHGPGAREHVSVCTDRGLCVQTARAHSSQPAVTAAPSTRPPSMVGRRCLLLGPLCVSAGEPVKQPRADKAYHPIRRLCELGHRRPRREKPETGRAPAPALPGGPRRPRAGMAPQEPEQGLAVNS